MGNTVNLRKINYGSYSMRFFLNICFSIDIKWLTILSYLKCHRHKATRAIQKVKNVYAHSPRMFCCSRSSISGVQCDVEKLPHAVVRRTLSRGKCRSGTVGLFPVSKNGARFANYEDLKDAIVTWLKNQAATWYEKSIHNLVSRYKYLNVKGDYVER